MSTTTKRLFIVLLGVMAVSIALGSSSSILVLAAGTPTAAAMQGTGATATTAPSAANPSTTATQKVNPTLTPKPTVTGAPAATNTPVVVATNPPVATNTPASVKTGTATAINPSAATGTPTPISTKAGVQTYTPTPTDEPFPTNTPTPPLGQYVQDTPIPLPTATPYPADTPTVVPTAMVVPTSIWARNSSGKSGVVAYMRGLTSLHMSPVLNAALAARSQPYVVGLQTPQAPAANQMVPNAAQPAQSTTGQGLPFGLANPLQSGEATRVAMAPGGIQSPGAIDQPSDLPNMPAGTQKEATVRDAFYYARRIGTLAVMGSAALLLLAGIFGVAATLFFVHGLLRR